MNYQIIIFLFFIIIFYSQKNKQIYIKSTLDNNYYLVNNYSNKNKIAYTLSFLRSKMIFLTENILINQENKIYIENLKRSIYNTQFVQNINKFPQKNVTSYSVNKGEKIVLCIYDYKNNYIYDLNTLLYVCIHELAHIANPTFGHDESFYFIFNHLLNEAIRLKIYNFYNFEKIPVKYCGIIIKTNL